MLKKILATALAALALAAHADTLLERIQNKGTITIGTEGVYPPFSYHDDSGKLTGYDVEVARLVADKLGVTVTFEETPWDAMLAGLKAGRFDLVANQVALSTPERRDTFDLSEPYSWSGQMVVARKSDGRTINALADIKGLKATQVLTSNHTHRAREVGADIVAVDSLTQGLILLEQGRADIALNDSLALLDYLKQKPDSQLEPVWRSPQDEQLGAGFVANKGNEEALAKISAAIVELREEGKLKALGEQYFGQDISQP